MKFCTGCDNMLETELRNATTKPELWYVCRHCGLADAVADGDGKSTMIMSTDYSDDKTLYMQYVTPYIRHDPTLPRVSDIKCASAKCKRPPSEEEEVIYIKYDPVQLKYLYHCLHCGTFWKSGGAVVRDGNASAAQAQVEKEVEKTPS
jgi:DNA-directed RNA polymerase subunit M/transcription elongation factor TFIIS